MTKTFKLYLGAAAVLGLLTSAQAGTLLTNHANVVACSDCETPAPTLPQFTTYGSGTTIGGIAEDGTVLFLSNLAGPDVNNFNKSALFSGTTFGDTTVVARWSDAAPGLPGLKLVANAGGSGISSNAVRISPDGRTFWSSRLTNATNNLPAGSDTALFAGFPGSLSVIAREGDPAPGTAAGTVYSGDFVDLTQQSTTINRNGSVVFTSSLSGGDVVGTTNNVALFSGTAGAIVMVVRKGDTMLPGPIKAASFPGQFQMDNNGRILYSLTLSGPGITTANDESFWVYTPGGGNTLLVREGTAAPGTVGAFFIGSPNMSLGVNAFTRSGRFAFVSGLAGGDVIAGANDQAFFVGSTSGLITLAKRKGDPAPGTDAVFSNFHPIFSYVNDSGAVAFEAGLTGGTSTTADNDGLWAGPLGSLTLVARKGALAPGAFGATFQGMNGMAFEFSDYGLVFIPGLQGAFVQQSNSRAIYAWTPSKGLFQVARTGEDLEVSPGTFKKQTGYGAGSGYYPNSDGAALGFTHAGKLTMSVSLDPGNAIVTLDLNCAPATDYYLDADGDGHGDPTTEINLCAGVAPPPGYITTSGDCNDSDPNSLGASPEVCNGLDDDCNARIDDLIPTPSGQVAMTLAKVGPDTVISWAAVPTAGGYDIVSGDLQELRGGGGYQFLSTGSCLADDWPNTSFTPTNSPTPGAAFWYLMRASNCGGHGSFNEGTPDQVSQRDNEIGASFYSCP